VRVGALKRKRVNVASILIGKTEYFQKIEVLICSTIDPGMNTQGSLILRGERILRGESVASIKFFARF